MDSNTNQGNLGINNNSNNIMDMLIDLDIKGEDKKDN